MGLGLKRSDLQKIALTKCDDAAFLLRNCRFSNAYYIGGYAIEIALKACIAKQFVAEVIPDKAFVQQIHTHSFKDLIRLAGLLAELKIKEDADSLFAANFALVAQWSPDVRYTIVDPMSAQTMISAIEDTNSGVLSWIKLYW